jgi:hypothetical protein
VVGLEDVGPNLTRAPAHLSCMQAGVEKLLVGYVSLSDERLG